MKTDKSMFACLDSERPLRFFPPLSLSPIFSGASVIRFLLIRTIFRSVLDVDLSAEGALFNEGNMRSHKEQTGRECNNKNANDRRKTTEGREDTGGE